MKSFGDSAPSKAVYEHFGITPRRSSKRHEDATTPEAATARPPSRHPHTPRKDSPCQFSVAINGFGHIGRNILRAIVKKSNARTSRS